MKKIKTITLIMFFSILLGCQSTSVNLPNVEQQSDANVLEECLYSAEVDTYYQLNSLRIMISTEFQKLDNLLIETDEANNVLNLYYVDCNEKELITTLQFLSTNDYNLENVEIDNNLKNYLELNNLEIYKTAGYIIVGTNKDTILSENLNDFVISHDENTNEKYKKLLDSIFGLNDFNGVDTVYKNEEYN